MTEKLHPVLKEKGPIKKIGMLGMGYVCIPEAALFTDANALTRSSDSRGFALKQLSNSDERKNSNWK